MDSDDVRDDGLGPYNYCKRGMSHCHDQFCNCVDVAKYRAMYQSSRERMEWDLPRTRSMLTVTLYLAMSALVGGLIGYVLALTFGEMIWDFWSRY